jgi:thimet oligopeptidase
LSQRITIPNYDAATMLAECDRMFDAARAGFDEIRAIRPEDADVRSVLDRWDRNLTLVEDVIGPVAILNSVSTDRAVRDAGDECLLRLSGFTTALFQDRELYERVRAVVPTAPAEAKFRSDLLEEFEDAGVGLEESARVRVRVINDEITSLGQEFARNVRENNEKVTFSAEECDGLPPSFLERVGRDADGRIALGFDTPDFTPFMMNARSGEARRRYYVAYANRGTDRNLAILDRIVRLRKELASLYGLPSFAHFVTRRRMVRNPETVHDFLSGVAAVVAETERADVDELRKVKAELTGVAPSETRIERWDALYYAERLRETRYAIDQEELRRYFPTLPTVSWLLEVTGRLYGIRFERADVERWHEDVVSYDVFESGDGSFVGSIYLDLFPREGKYKHAAAWPIRGVATRQGRTPISVLVTNFDRKGLTHGELETLFHEFGHVMHGVLSKTEFNYHSGTSVQRDFVEAPSQMFEEWARRWASLSTLCDAAPDAPALDEDLVSRLAAARRFGQGIRYARQHLYATFDMALSGSDPRGALEVWREMESAGPMGHVDGTAFPGTFGHIADGYAAGYYGYMWSEVLALDMLSVFGDDLMSEATGRRFRDVILARGAEAPADDLVREFLGRSVSSEAFFREIRGER